MYRLGDRVEVKLVEAAPLAGALRFEMLTEGRILPRKDRPAEPSRTPKGKAKSRPRAPEKKRGRR
jgi:ribonuclease R